METNRILDCIDSDALTQDALDFLKVKSETRQERDGTLFLADLLRREGFEPILDDVEPGRANVYSLLKGAGSGFAGRGSSLLFNGHLDTVAVGNCQPPAIQDGWLIGRGAEDMKGGLISMVHAVSALRKAGAPMAGDLWFTAVIGHEDPKGRKEGPRRLIHHLRTGKIKADAIIIGEGPCAIWNASLGMTIFTVSIGSARGSIHTIKVPYTENPARWLGELLRDFDRLEQSFCAAAQHFLCGRERINVGSVLGGDYYNRLPTPIVVTGTWRWNENKTFGDIEQQLRQICNSLAQASGLSFDVSFNATREPFHTPDDHPVILALQKAGLAASGNAPETIGMAIVGDATFYVNEGRIPTVYYGPAYETAHSDNERVPIAQLVHCAKVYALAAAIFCGARSGTASPCGSTQ